ncbi:MAG TPA: GTPase ObgE [Oligoflexia bacterium]|nr:GTPase ObgE [Oligoflexia bacterium]HMP27896.1 GTPase ObgE [Oligoflexia bacterium]
MTQFIDSAEIVVKAGDGGAGSVSFRREKFVPRGGPDGGDGGDGGNVILRANPQINTLLDFKYKRHFEAGSGGAGSGRQAAGRDGEDVIIEVPVGTEIINADSKEMIIDLNRENMIFTIARGGRGGKGNAFFKSATNQTPDYAQPGEKGETFRLLLSLKLLADVALVGAPNAGKSTFIASVSAARPKIADYPFTTLVPNLGVVSTDYGKRFVIADIPGLIPLAHQGKGLGYQFLKHIERCRVIAHLIELTPLIEEGANATTASDLLIKNFQQINSELELFSPALRAKPQLILLTKMDLINDQKKINRIIKNFEKLGEKAIAISSVNPQTLQQATNALFALLERS